MHKPEQCPPNAEPMPIAMPTSNALSMPKGCPTMPEVEVEVENYKTLNSPSIPTSGTSTRDDATVDGPTLRPCPICGQPVRLDCYCVRTPACTEAANEHFYGRRTPIVISEDLITTAPNPHPHPDSFGRDPSIHVEPQQASEHETTTGEATTGQVASHARTTSSSLRKFQVEVRQADGSYVEAGHVSYFPVTPFNPDDVFELTRLDRVRMLPSRFGYWLRPYDMLLDARRWRWVKSGARRQAEWLTPERLEAIATAVEAKLRDHDA